jgi:hypothetical protein
LVPTFRQPCGSFAAQKITSPVSTRFVWPFCINFERAFLQDYPALPPEAITAAVDELTRDRSDSRVGSLTADWERFFEVLPHGHQAHRARGRAARA